MKEADELRMCGPVRWWQTRGFLAIVAIASAVPLLWPELPPLVDVPGHIGRYRIQLDLHSSPDLQRYYEFRWALVANLGVDLLVVPLEPLLGLEPAVKLIVLLIPPLTALGLFWVAAEVHGRVPATSLFAVPFVYGYPFNFGFINFALSMTLALLAFGLWLRLTRERRFQLRVLLFIPGGCLIWVCHAFGWAVLGLLVLSSEFVRFRDCGESWRLAAAKAAILSVPLALPLLLMLAWRNGDGGPTKDFFDFAWKAYAFMSAARDRWLIWDCFSLAAPIVLLAAGIFDRNLQISRKLAIPAAVLGCAFLLLPRTVFGSSFADMRIAPYMIMLAVLGVRVRSEAFVAASRIAWIASIFVILRLAGNAISFAIADSDAREKLQALNHVPRGAAVLTLVGMDCRNDWALPRHWHLAALAIARKHAFSNDQWQVPGAQLSRAKYAGAGAFREESSKNIISQACRLELTRKLGKQLPVRLTEEALAEFPREGFDYLWVIRPPETIEFRQFGLVPVWAGRDSALYRVVGP